MGSDSRAQNAGRKTNYLVSGHLQPCPKSHPIKSNWKPKVTAQGIQLSSAAVDCTLFSEPVQDQITWLLPNQASPLGGVSPKQCFVCFDVHSGLICFPYLCEFGPER